MSTNGTANRVTYESSPIPGMEDLVDYVLGHEHVKYVRVVAFARRVDTNSGKARAPVVSGRSDCARITYFHEKMEQGLLVYAQPLTGMEDLVPELREWLTNWKPKTITLPPPSRLSTVMQPAPPTTRPPAFAPSGEIAPPLTPTESKHPSTPPTPPVQTEPEEPGSEEQEDEEEVESESGDPECTDAGTTEPSPEPENDDMGRTVELSPTQAQTYEFLMKSMPKNADEVQIERITGKLNREFGENQGNNRYMALKNKKLIKDRGGLKFLLRREYTVTGAENGNGRRAAPPKKTDAPKATRQSSNGHAAAKTERSPLDLRVILDFFRQEKTNIEKARTLVAEADERLEVVKAFGLEIVWDKDEPMLRDRR